MNILLFLLLFPLYAKAGEVSVQLTQFSRIADGDTSQTSNWNGVQVDYKLDNGVYIFGGKEKATIHLMGEAFSYDITSIGFGTKFNISERVRLFGQVGYYFVDNSWGSEIRREKNEALIYYLNDKFSNNGQIQNFDAFSVDNENTFGGTAGIEIVQPITKNLSAGFVFSHRNMKIKEIVHGYNDAWRFHETGENWEYGVSRNYSSFNFGISFNYILW